MKIVDLSRELYHGTPTYPGHPPIIHGVWKTHEESFAESGKVHGLSQGRPADERIPPGELHRAGHLH